MLEMSEHLFTRMKILEANPELFRNLQNLQLKVTGFALLNVREAAQKLEFFFTGIYLSGVRQSHPFKVIEPEPDRRSVCSETRSSHGRSSVPKSIHDPNSRAESLAKLSNVSHSAVCLPRNCLLHKVAFCLH